MALDRSNGYLGLQDPGARVHRAGHPAFHGGILQLKRELLPRDFQPNFVVFYGLRTSREMPDCSAEAHRYGSVGIKICEDEGQFVSTDKR